MKTYDQIYNEWTKSASLRTAIDDWFSSQVDASEAMRSDSSPVVADPDLIKRRIYDSFKMGTLAGLLAAAAGAAIGAPLGLPNIGAALGGYAGLLGGVIKGQADANRSFLEEKGLTPKYINLLRYTVPDQRAAYLATTVLPESGFFTVNRQHDYNNIISHIRDAAANGGAREAGEYWRRGARLL